jgi:hypothetical protein
MSCSLLVETMSHVSTEEQLKRTGFYLALVSSAAESYRM